MKIQLIEAFQGGHHTNYIDALLPTFRRALERGEITEALVTVTKRHYDSLVQQGIVKPESLNLRFSASFPEISPAPNMRDRLQLFEAFNHSVKAAGSDAVISTSADYDVMMRALFKNKAVSSIRSVGIFHYGYPSHRHAGLTFKEKIKQTIYETSWHHANWDRFLFVNPVVYESLTKKNNAFSRKIRLLPDPVPTKINVDSIEARKRLNIPTDGIYIGFVGMMDERKAIPELLAGFVQAKAYDHCRLLLAGQMTPQTLQLIDAQYHQLVARGRIVLINRHLSNDEIQLGYAAVNINALLQYRRMNLSANLLKAVAYEKPIIVDDCGYTGMMVRRFALGQVCNVNDLSSVSQAILLALENLDRFKPSIQSKRLVQFHHPDNYAKTIMNELFNGKNAMQYADVLTWDWVCEGL